MLEIIATLDVIEDSAKEGQNFVNFVRQAQVCNLEPLFERYLILFQVLFPSLSLFHIILILGTYTSTIFRPLQLLIIGGAHGLWPLPIRQPIRASEISYENPMNPFHAEMDVLVMGTDINLSPGFRE